MRPIDAVALADVLNNLWVATSPSKYDDKETAFERAAMCRGIDDCIKYVHDSPTIGGWISVKDRLPEKKQTVMVSLVSEIDGHRIKRPQLGYPADDTGDMWYIVPWGEWAVDIDFKVTHWMPLPEPPKG